MNVFLSISSSSSTVHRLFVVFAHLLWLSRYSLFGNKLGFTNTGKFFFGVVTWLVWIPFYNKSYFAFVPSQRRPSYSHLVLNKSAQRTRRSSSSSVQKNVSALTKSGSDYWIGSLDWIIGPDHRIVSRKKTQGKKKNIRK